MIQVALLTLCICTLSSLAQLPSLPQSFSADAQVTMPFLPPVPAFMYYDYPNSRQRIDMNQFGSSFITLYRYDLKAMYQISGSPGSYECQAQELDDVMYSMDIPPFATYAGSQQVNGYDCDEYQASLLGYIDLTFYITNITTADGKTTPVLVEFTIDVAGQQTAFDLSNVVPGPQDSALFDPSVFNCQPPPPPVTYTVSGYVKSAVTTEAISGAVVYLGTQSSTTTDGNGAYSFTGVAPGNYAIKAAASGYINSLLNLNVTGDINAGTIADFNLSPTLAQNQYRFVLTWGSYPTDLDSHLTTPWSCNVYFGNRYCSSGSSTANLDVDDTNGYGPETVTLYTPTSSSASFTYYVYQYSAGGSLLSSNGRVQVYGSTGLLYDVHVPTSGYPASSRNWNVFTYKNGQFTISNTLSS